MRCIAIYLYFYLFYLSINSLHNCYYLILYYFLTGSGKMSEAEFDLSEPGDSS